MPPAPPDGAEPPWEAVTVTVWAGIVTVTV